MLLYVFGFLLVLLLFATMIYPAILSIIQGECWGVNVYNTIQGIKSEVNGLTPGGQPAKITVTLPDCAEHMAFLNEDEVSEYYLRYFLAAEGDNVFKCPKDYKVYMIAMPFFEETETKWYELWKLPKDLVKEEIEKIYKEKFKQIKPHCDIADPCKDDCSFDGSLDDRVLLGSRKKGEVRTYCLSISRIGSTGKTLHIDFKDGEC
jgi:hypothetical protein